LADFAGEGAGSPSSISVRQGPDPSAARQRPLSVTYRTSQATRGCLCWPGQRDTGEVRRGIRRGNHRPTAGEPSEGGRSGAAAHGGGEHGHAIAGTDGGRRGDGQGDAFAQVRESIVKTRQHLLANNALVNESMNVGTLSAWSRTLGPCSIRAGTYSTPMRPS